jgi:NADH-dependent peroxiredoxin subunit F
MYDLIIMGAGPAGMTAAVYAARKKLDTLLISKDVGGQTNLTLNIENYMGYQFIEGPELTRKFEAQVKQFPVDMRIGENAVKVTNIEGGFEVLTEKEATYQGRSVIVCTGKRPRSLDVPGEKTLIGRGVSYCAVCDGPFFRNAKVAVVGGGNSALEAANDLARIADHVYLVSLAGLTGDHVLIEKASRAPNLTTLTEHKTISVTGDQLVTGMVIRNLKTDELLSLDLEGVFVEIGLVPNSDSVRGLVPLNGLGEIEVNCTCETTVPGLFGAGDVTNVPQKQIVVAAGEGAKAALQAHRYLQRLP